MYSLSLWRVRRFSPKGQSKLSHYVFNSLMFSYFRLLLAMFSPSLASLLSDIPSNETPGVTVPADTDTLINTIKVLVDGKVTCNEEGDLNKIIEVGNVLGLSFNGLLQIPLYKEKEKNSIYIPNLRDERKDTAVYINDDIKPLMKSVKDPLNVNYNCEVCNEKMLGRTHFKSHMRDMHGMDGRTEPMSAYSAFLHEEKKDVLAANPYGKLNIEQAIRKWKEMTENGKQKYKDLAMEDKRRLGGNYRLGRKRKPKRNILLCGRGCGSQFENQQAWQDHVQICRFLSAV